MEFKIVNRKGVIFTVLFDEQDKELIERYTWHIFNVKTPYPRATIKLNSGGYRFEFLHRLITGVTDSKTHVDHKNGNELDNRRDNLRITTHSKNTQNRKSYKDSTSVYLGVSFHSYGGKWRALLRSKHLGYFTDQIEAAKCYDAAAKEAYGEFANLNFPE